MPPVGKFLMIMGVTLLLVGAWITFGPKLPFPLGRLPGDIFIQKERFTFSFPIVTCLIISLVLTLLLNFIFRR
jgi:hypothetical protein